MKDLEINVSINHEVVFTDHPKKPHFQNPVLYPLEASGTNESLLYESEGSIARIVGEPIITLPLLDIQSRSTCNGGYQFYLARLSHKGTSRSLRS